MTNTITLEKPTEKPISALAVQLNESLANQERTSPFNRLDRCDRCPSAAQSTFNYRRGELLLCGHDMRKHLAGILDSNVTSFWIEPKELWHVRGVEAPGQNFKKAGDGLTDA